MTDSLVVWLVPGGCLVGLGILLWKGKRFSASRAEGLNQLAEARGWTYEDMGGTALARQDSLPVHGEDLDPVYQTTLLGTYKRAAVWQRVRGEVDGLSFECLQVNGQLGGKDGAEDLSVASLKCELGTGSFSIIPQDFASHMRGLVGRPSVSTGNAEFDRRFRVEAEDEASVRAYLSPDVLDYLSLHLHGRLYGLTDRLTYVLMQDLTAEVVLETTGFLEGLWRVVPAELKG